MALPETKLCVRDIQIGHSSGRTGAFALAVKSAVIHDVLVSTGPAGLEGVWAHEVGGGRQLLAVSVHQRYAEHARQAGHLTAQLLAVAYMSELVIVVDGDVDPRSLSDVVWAVCTRTEPGRDIDVQRYTWGGRVDPLCEPGAPAYNAIAVIDACRPFGRLAGFPGVAETSRELRDRVLAKWPDVLG